LVEEIFQTAKKLKQQVYGNRIVLFAPLYVGNECINGCLYCGFRVENKELIRKTLTDEELEQELYALTSVGINVSLWYSGTSMYSPEYIAGVIRKIYALKTDLEKSGA